MNETIQQGRPAGVRPTGFFVLRTALLPFDVLLEWAAGTGAAGHATPERDQPLLPATIVDQRSSLIQRLKGIVRRTDVQEALFIASASTYHELARWMNEPGAEDPKLERTLTRYVQRMAGRATPFGLFAGCSVGEIGATTDIVLSSASEYRRHSRLDNDYLCALTHYLNGKSEVQARTQYRPNSSLYRLGRTWRFVQTIFVGMTRRDSLVGLEADDFLVAALERARDGATLDEVARHVAAADPDGDISTEDATDYVRELIRQQVIVSDLEPVVTGEEPLADILGQLRRMASCQELETATATLAQVQEQLTAIDGSPLGIDVERYRTIGQQLAVLGVPPDPSRLFQVDITKASPAARCGPDVVEEIVQAVTLLHRLSPSVESEPLRRFREAFTARYERQEVPLVEALDEESGIGFDRSEAPAAENAPLLDGIPLPSVGDAAGARWTERDSFLLSKLEVMRATAGELVLGLTDDDVELLARSGTDHPLPDAFSVLAVVGIAPDTRAVTDVLIRYAAGPSGAGLLGRFCHADQELHSFVGKHLAAEQSFRPDAAFAEIVHLPMGRMGNVLARPVLRDFEIPYLGRSGAPDERQISITDLLVSVEQNRVILRSKRLGREIIPRMTNMHNYRTGQGIYRFLCSLQGQLVSPIQQWNWGGLQTRDFLPRVVHKKQVLCRARWRLDRRMLRRFTGDSFPDQLRHLQSWRQSEHLPRFVAFVEGDNELPVDFDNLLSVETLLYALRNRADATLVEMYPRPEALGAYGPEGRFVHEIVVPFIKTEITKHETYVRHESPPVPRARRTFVPGSEWLYVKCYTGTSNADRLLARGVADLVARQAAAGTVARWFFVRYGDPDWHLRLRFHGDPEQLTRQVLPELSQIIAEAIADGAVWKMQIDTYHREIERYGGESGMELSEDFFWRDSESVLEILRLLPGDEGVDARWRLCVRSWDVLLSDLGCSLETKRRLMVDMRDRWAGQLRAAKATTRALGDRFRSERQSLEALFNGNEATHPLASALAVLRRRSQALAGTMQALRDERGHGRLTVPVEVLVGPYLHMHTNRLLRSAHQPQEFVISDFLCRLYEAQMARARGRGRRSAELGQ